MENEDKYARRCDITGLGMNEGYCIRDGEMYIASKDDLLIHLKGLHWEDADGSEVNELGLDDDSFIEYFYNEEYLYWTEWEELDEDGYYLEDGTHIETL
jgi:hypothetical protein